MVRRLSLVLVLWLLVSCKAASSLPTVKLQFASPEGSISSDFTMEVVASPESRAKGLMFRRSIGIDEGMIFLFPSEEEHSFWMKNTLIPLDMIFVSHDWKVVGIIENVPPLTEDHRTVAAPSKFVLEFAAGTAKKVGIVRGSQVVVRGQLPPVL